MKWGRNFIYGLFMALCLLPFAMLLYNSVWNGSFTLEQYGRALLQSPRFFRGFWNSVLYTGAILLVNIPVSLVAAYGYTRFSFVGKQGIFYLIVVAMLLPFQATLVPQYIILKAMGILNTPAAVVLPNMFSTFGLFLMIQYLRSFDRMLYEAAEMDGVGDFRVFLHLVLPICRPLATSLTILCFINYWSMVEHPVTFLIESGDMPLSVSLSDGSLSPISAACGVLFCILPLILYAYSNDSLQGGIGLLAGRSQSRPAPQKKSRCVRVVITFLTVMLVFTLATQKVAGLMAPRVTLYSTDRQPPVLRQYAVVVPNECVFPSELRPYVLVYDATNGTVKSVGVTAEESRDGYTGIVSTLPWGVKLVCHTTKAVANGDAVIVVGEAYEYE